MYNLYVNKDIPSEYHYIRVGSNYYDLFNKPTAHNETLSYYRVYYDISQDFYTQRQETFGQYYSTTFEDIGVTNNIMARRDIGDLFICVGFTLIGILWTFNLFTSCFKRGGVLGGLF